MDLHLCHARSARKVREVGIFRHSSIREDSEDTVW